jgi:hypothetical protein
MASLLATALVGWVRGSGLNLHNELASLQPGYGQKKGCRWDLQFQVISGAAVRGCSACGDVGASHWAGPQHTPVAKCSCLKLAEHGCFPALRNDAFLRCRQTSFGQAKADIRVFSYSGDVAQLPVPLLSTVVEASGDSYEAPGLNGRATCATAAHWKCLHSMRVTGQTLWPHREQRKRHARSPPFHAQPLRGKRGGEVARLQLQGIEIPHPSSRSSTLTYLGLTRQRYRCC